MTTLKFGKATKITGFTPHETAQFNHTPPAIIVRELVQNSQDAAVEAGETTARVTFQVSKLTSDDVPDISGYRKAFDKAVEHWTAQNDGNLTDPAQEVVNRIGHALQQLKNGDAKICP